MKTTPVRYQVLCAVGFVLSLTGAAVFAGPSNAHRETTAVATSSRHTDPNAAAKAGTAPFMGAGQLPLIPGDANAVLDGDRT
ncbi:MAG: hypothetical protein WC701_07105, partial [Kiritimatiellales bacterium]